MFDAGWERWWQGAVSVWLIRPASTLTSVKSNHFAFPAVTGRLLILSLLFSSLNLPTMSKPKVVVYTTPPLTPLPASDSESIYLLAAVRAGGVNPGVQTADWAANGELAPRAHLTSPSQGLCRAERRGHPNRLPLVPLWLERPRCGLERRAGGRRGRVEGVHRRADHRPRRKSPSHTRS